MSEYFSNPNSLGANVNVKLDLSIYATKSDLKNAAGVDTLSVAKKTDLANLKSDVDKLDIDKLKNVPTNLNNLKSKVDKLVKKTDYNTKISEIENKISDHDHTKYITTQEFNRLTADNFTATSKVSKQK